VFLDFIKDIHRYILNTLLNISIDTSINTSLDISVHSLVGISLGISIDTSVNTLLDISVHSSVDISLDTSVHNGQVKNPFQCHTEQPSLKAHSVPIHPFIWINFRKSSASGESLLIPTNQSFLDIPGILWDALGSCGIC
jgi:hypothetical protein